MNIYAKARALTTPLMMATTTLDRVLLASTFLRIACVTGMDTSAQYELFYVFEAGALFVSVMSGKPLAMGLQQKHQKHKSFRLRQWS